MSKMHLWIGFLAAWNRIFLVLAAVHVVNWFGVLEYTEPIQVGDWPFLALGRFYILASCVAGALEWQLRYWKERD